MVPFYYLCAVAGSRSLRIFYPHLLEYQGAYVADLVMLALVLWALLLLCIMLAVLFFSRHRMFRPLLIYFPLLPPLLLVASPSITTTSHRPIGPASMLTAPMHGSDSVSWRRSPSGRFITGSHPA